MELSSVHHRPQTCHVTIAVIFGTAKQMEQNELVHTMKKKKKVSTLFP